MVFLEVLDIWFSYENSNYVLKGVNLKAKKGELVVLLGPSGCGKTTLLKIISGILKPDKGKIFLDEIDITDKPPWDREIGFVFQNLALFPHLTVWENIAFGLEAKGFSKDDIERRVRELLEMLNLVGLENRFPREISGGQQQRVALARALAPYPKLLLLDEPFANLDAVIRERLREEIREVIKGSSITTIFVTHDQMEAFQIADRIAIMIDGEIKVFGKPEEIIKNPKNGEVAEFLRLNILRVSKMGDEAFLGDQKIPCKTRTGRIIVHPKDIIIDNERGLIVGRIVSISFQKYIWVSKIELDDGQLVEVISQDKIGEVGDKVKLIIKHCIEG